MKKTAIFTIVTLIAIGAAFYFYGYLNNDFINFNKNNNNNNNKITNDKILINLLIKDSTENKEINQVAEKNKKFVCGDNIQHSTLFVSECLIPFPCSQPVGLTVD